MAIAVNGGHISRALDFYDTAGKYFIVGGTAAWTDDSAPPAPTVEDYKLTDIVGLKKVDNTHMVIPAADDATGEDIISYRNQKWKKVTARITTTVGEGGITNGATAFTVQSANGIVVGSRLRVANTYEGKVTNITGSRVTLDTAAPKSIPTGSAVIGGALVEGARYVYVECYLNYDAFPLVTYRQIGLCTSVAMTEDILVTESYQNGLSAVPAIYNNSGLLEVLDNRVPNTRDINQRELLSLIIEF